MSDKSGLTECSSILPSDRAVQHILHRAKDLLSMLKRRPCAFNHICLGLNIARNEARKYLRQLQQHALNDSVERDGATFFMAARPPKSRR